METRLELLLSNKSKGELKLKTMKKIFMYIAVVSTALFSIACQEDPEPGGMETEELAGEWWVTYQVETSPGVLEDIAGGYYKMMTYNTASNTDSIWIDDLEHFWEYKVKAKVGLANNTFSVSEGSNFVYESAVTIENGKVLVGQGKSVSGVKTDSIYFEVSFDDDATPYETKYIVSGHRRTGFLEDELE